VAVGYRIGKTVYHGNHINCTSSCSESICCMDLWTRLRVVVVDGQWVCGWHLILNQLSEEHTFHQMIATMAGQDSKQFLQGYLPQYVSFTVDDLGTKILAADILKSLLIGKEHLLLMMCYLLCTLKFLELCIYQPNVLNYNFRNCYHILVKFGT